MRTLTLLLSIAWLAPCALAQDAPAQPAQAPAAAKSDSDANPADSQAKPADKQADKNADKKAGNQKAAPAKADQGAKKEEAPEEEEAKPKAPYHPDFAVEPGFGDWNISGNEHKFRQYATPPRGVYLKEFLYDPLPSAKGSSGFLTLRGWGEEDYRNEGKFSFLYGGTQAEAAFWRNRFFDPTPVFIPESRRAINELYGKQFLTRGISLSARYRQIDQDHLFEPPLDPFHQRTRYWDTFAEGRVGNGLLRAGYTDWRYFDRTSILYDTAVTGWHAGYLWEPTRAIDLSAEASWFDVKQTGVLFGPNAPSAAGGPTGHIDVQSLTGNTDIGSNTAAGFNLRRDHLSLPLVRTAYAREQRSATFNVSHRIRNWSGLLSYQIRDMERVRGDQTFVDVPEFSTFEGRVYGRLLKDLRLTVRGYVQNISSLPPMVTEDPRPLYWNARQFAQVKLDHGNIDFNTYLSFTYRNWDNNARNSHLSFNSVVLGGNWQASPSLNLFLEYTKENWDGHNEITDSTTLEHFTPDSHVIAAGASYVFSPQAFLSLNVSSFGTANDNPLLLRDGNTSGTLFTINARYLFPSGNELGLIIAPWTYRDDVVGQMNYDTAVVMVTGRVRF